MYQAILVVHILLSLGIIGLVLLQRGKGAEMGAGFGGGGASQTLFGSTGSSSFLTHTTAWLATGFFVSCLVLSYLAGHLTNKQTAAYLPEQATSLEVPITQVPISGLPAAPVSAPVEVVESPVQP